MDEDCQIPVITQILGMNEGGEIRESTNGTTLGKSVKRYTRGNPASNAQIKGPPSLKNMPKKDDLDPAEAFEEAKTEEDLFDNPDVPNPDEAAASSTSGPQAADAPDPIDMRTIQQTPQQAAAEAEERRLRATPERALKKLDDEYGGTSIKNIPGGVYVNQNLTPSQLEQVESKGYIYEPDSDGGGHIYAKRGQNYG